MSSLQRTHCSQKCKKARVSRLLKQSQLTGMKEHNSRHDSALLESLYSDGPESIISAHQTSAGGRGWFTRRIITVIMWDAICCHDCCILFLEWNQRGNQVISRSWTTTEIPITGTTKCSVWMSSSQVSCEFNICLVSRTQPEKFDRFHRIWPPNRVARWCQTAWNPSPCPVPDWKLTIFCLCDSPSMDISKDVHQPPAMFR